MDFGSILNSRLGQLALSYINYGISGYDRQTQRRMMVTNTFCLYVSITGMPYAVFYVIYDLGLLPLSMYVGIGMIICFILPFFNKYGSTIAITGFTCVWMPGALVLCYSLSTESGTQYIYFTFAGLWLVTYGYENRKTVLFLFVVGIILFLISDHYFREPGLAGADQFLANIVRYSFVPNLFMMIFFIVLYSLFVTNQIEGELKEAHNLSERLLRNILPDKIAERLKTAPDEIIADSISDVTILFADIVNFTPRATTMSASQLVVFLDRIFTKFDELTAARGLTKIKTIGDAYMVAAGMPEARKDHAEAVAELAFEMLAACEELSKESGEEINVRIGLHTGPAVAGVIGRQRFAYDVWGDTVNTAARMESHGEPVKIQVTEATLTALGNKYHYEPRGHVEIKGKGLMETWWLRRHPSPAS